MTKICTGCKQAKPLEDFSLQSTGKFGRIAKCKTCKNLMAKDYFSRNKVKILARQKKYFFRKLRIYGITKEIFEELVHAQQSKCAICETVPKILCIDHDHTTKRIRGLLCAPCNSAIGMLHDNPVLMQRAAAYVEKWRKAQEFNLFTMNHTVAIV